MLGNPPFMVTEFGDKIGWADCPDAATQARAATLWVQKLKTVPNCIGGQWFLDYDGSAWSGFGLRDASGNKRPSWQTYHDAVAGALTAHTFKALTADPHPDAADRPSERELAEFQQAKQHAFSQPPA